MTRRSGPIYVLGAASMPGWSLLRHPAGNRLVPFGGARAKAPASRGWRRFNLEDGGAYARLFAGEPPRALVHCGGVCDVEKCEAHPAWARAVNVESLGYLLACLPAATRLVYISSDHVFSGRRRAYDERSRPSPLTEYGRLRIAAERLILKKRPDALVLRYALCVGPSSGGRTGHLDWLRYRTRRGLPITLVRDEYRSAVRAEDLARRILAYVDSAAAGIRHIAAAAVSRPELAEYLNRRFRIGARFTLVSRADRPVPHLGRVELATVYRDALAAPLPAVVRA